jgi:hypothetical protein
MHKATNIDPRRIRGRPVRPAGQARPIRMDLLTVPDARRKRKRRAPCHQEPAVIS